MKGKILLLTAISIQIFFLAFTEESKAHAPHDVISDIYISPEFETNKVLLSVIRGILLRSTDEGKTWKKIVQGLPSSYRLNELDSSPKDSNTIYLSSEGNGIYKSVDYGLSWKNTSRNLQDKKIGTIKASPTSSQEVIASGQAGGVYITTDGGGSWKQVISEKIKINAIEFFEEKVLLGGQDGRLHILKNNRKDTETVEIKGGCQISSIAANKNSSASPLLFLGTNNCGLFYSNTDLSSFQKAEDKFLDEPIKSIQFSPDFSVDSKIYLSTTGKGAFCFIKDEENWEECSNGLTKDKQAEKYKEPHFTKLAISPSFSKDRTIFLEGFNGLFKSENAGESWSEVDTLSPEIIVGLDVSPNYKNDSTAAVSTYLGGAYLTNNSGMDWSPINNGILSFARLFEKDQIERIFSIKFSPNYIKDRTIFSSSWWDFLRFKSSNKIWVRVPGKKENIAVTIDFSPDYDEDQTLYTGSDRGHIFKSQDGGKNFSKVKSFKGEISSLSISPSFKSNRKILAIVNNKLHETSDAGKSWKEVNFFSELFVRSAEILTDSSSGIKSIVATNEGIYSQSTSEESWEKFSDENVDQYIEALAVSPNFKNDEILLVSVSGKGLFKSNNGGEIFYEVGRELIKNNHLLSNFSSSSNVTSQPIKFSPTFSEDNTVYGYSDKSTFRSVDGGETWEEVGVPKLNKNKFLLYTTMSFRKYILYFLAAFLVIIFITIKARKRSISENHKAS
ncbi:Xyloglucanase Xgh74A [Acaryochloris thomasi RCC1774]|uniref:Xyloglucanase Xgh74A n=1 Tax=Acaryochloris thomasi RCC1774 TaxID=1764569 RepID=A0A2W1JIU5_9CYAN|nr:hypothetical protein [Acaryochloris thomasi]PZD73413.1 Xyloglucanase Xgh74A [Acaryochloris thomasi RCC1774]